MYAHLFRLAAIAGVCAAIVIVPVGSSHDAGALLKTPSVSVTTSNTNNSTTFTIHVQNLDANTKFKDFHVDPISGKKFPSTTGGTTVSVTPSGGGSAQTWQLSGGGTGGSINVNTGTGQNPPAGFGDGDYTITVPFDPTQFGKGQDFACAWSATSDGLKKAGANGTIATSAGTSAPNVRQITMSINGGSGLPLPINTTTTLRVGTETGFSGYTYQVYTATKVNPDYTDPLGIGLETVDYPVPSGWGLTFSNFGGTLTSNGIPSTMPTIAVPNNTSLRGDAFYAVFALLDEHGVVILASDPITCTVTVP